MLDKVIMRSLKTDPSARFQNAAEMREALEAALREPELQRNRRRRAGLVALGAVMSALVAGAVTVGNDPELAGRASAKVEPMLNYLRELRQGKAAAPARAANEQANALAKAAPESAKSVPVAAEADDAEPSEPELAMAEETDETEEPEVDIDLDLDAPDALAAAPAADSGELAQAGAAEAAGADGESDAEGTEAEAPSAAGETEAGPASAELEALLVQAEQQMTEGNRLKGFNTIKRLAWKHPKDARALRAYSEAAVSMKAWGEAYRAAYNWAEVDPSPDAKLQLAKLERATSRGNYKSTLKKLLAQHPDHAEATALLGGASNKALAQRDE